MSETRATPRNGLEQPDPRLSGGSFIARHGLVLLILAAFLNSQVGQAVKTIAKHGFLTAAGGTFGTSAVIWLGLILTLDLLLRARTRIRSGADLGVMALTTLFVAYPVPEVSWLGLTVLGAYLWVARADEPETRRAAVLLLAVCFSGFWSRLISRQLLDYILSVDTFLVALLTGQPYDQNVIVAADGETIFKIMEGCSSFANLSLAFLGWMIGRAYYGTHGFARSVLFVTLSGLLIVAVNTTRIAIMVLRPDLFGLAHGPVGASVAATLTTVLVLGVTAYGARR